MLFDPDAPLRTPVAPFFREVGSGRGIVCLHASGSSSSQWRSLMETLSPKHRVIAPDSYGSGKSPAWPRGRPLSLRDEAAFLEPVFSRAGERFSLIAHSYGAAVALVAALERPERVQALALYEPTLFALVDAESPPPNDAECFRRVFARVTAALGAGDTHGAAREFVDYWSGPGTWERVPEERKGSIAASMANAPDWAAAAFGEKTPLSAFSRLRIPVLYMIGKESPASSRAVARLLTRTLPIVEVVEFEGVGHMGPVTHPEIVNETITAFLERWHIRRLDPGVALWLARAT